MVTSDYMVMPYGSRTFERITQDSKYLRNAPHFYGVAVTQAPRLLGYIAAGAMTAVVGGMGGWIGNRIATAVAYPFEIVSEGIFHNPSGYEFVVSPFRALEGPIAFVIAAAGVMGLAVGATLGARAGLAAGRRVADFWTRNVENRNVVEGRVRRHFRDVRRISAAVPPRARESPLDAETRRYMDALYS